MTKRSEQALQLYVAAFLCVVGSGLLIAGFCVAPRGEIHHSILIAFGEILSFVGAVFGIHYSYSYKSKKDLQL